MKADNILVVQKGRVVQQGTHAQLLADRDGPYWSLANAQQLSMSENSVPQLEELGLCDAENHDGEPPVFHMFNMDLESITSCEEPVYKPKWLFGSFGLFIWEQKPHWRWYSLMLAGALGAGSKTHQENTTLPISPDLWPQADSSCQLPFLYMHSCSPSLSHSSIFGDNIYTTRPIGGVSCLAYSRSGLERATLFSVGRPIPFHL